MKRREFITLLGAVVASQLPARAQQHTIHLRRVGVVMGYPETDTEAQRRVAVLRDALAQLGWVQGQNVDILVRFAGSDTELVRVAAREFVEAAADVIVSNPAPVIPPLLPIIGNTPVVFANIPDPVAIGLVASLARPGGNVTGVTNFEPALAGKWLELLKEVAPQISRIGIIYDPETPAWGERLRVLGLLAPRMGVQLAPIPVRSPGDLENQLGALAGEPRVGLIVLPGSFTTVHRKAILALTRQHRLPAIYPFQYFVAEGGLISYGPDTLDQFRRAASYVHRILTGEKPPDLPVEAPTKFELVINLKTAGTFGLTIPPTLLARADEVIE